MQPEASSIAQPGAPLRVLSYDPPCCLQRLAILNFVFAVRDDKIRVISARDMSRKERGVYDAASS